MKVTNKKNFSAPFEALSFNGTDFRGEGEKLLADIPDCCHKKNQRDSKFSFAG